MVIYLDRDADLHMVQLMPLPLTVCCFSKIQIAFTFLVSAHRGSPGQRAVKRVRVCIYSFHNEKLYELAVQLFSLIYECVSLSNSSVQ